MTVKRCNTTTERCNTHCKMPKDANNDIEMQTTTKRHKTTTNRLEMITDAK